jgi:hypothetical protein
MNDMAPPNPHDIAGWFVVALGTLATVGAFALAIKVTIWPGERGVDHPKRIILRDDR